VPLGPRTIFLGRQEGHMYLLIIRKNPNLLPRRQILSKRPRSGFDQLPNKPGIIPPFKNPPDMVNVTGLVNAGDTAGLNQGTFDGNELLDACEGFSGRQKVLLRANILYSPSKKIGNFSFSHCDSNTYSH